MVGSVDIEICGSLPQHSTQKLDGKTHDTSKLAENWHPNIQLF